MTRPLYDEWIARFRAVARPALQGTPVLDPHADADARRRFAAGFADEHGNRRRLDRPFLHALLGLGPPDVAPATADLDDRLWWALHDPGITLPDPDAEGPLDPAQADAAIEWRTEVELAATHALFRIALDRADPALTRRALAAARWQVAELQPDNATNHPWAAHVFLVLAAEDPQIAPEALLHAQTMVHNCQVHLGRADRRSACILWDAADTLERLGR